MKSKISVLLATGLLAAPLAAFGAPINLVTNGDFEAGNSGFSSSYSYAPGGNATEGQYTVRTNPNPWNPAFISTGDHTSGSGQMFVGNGSPVSGAIVWESVAIPVAASTGYFFEAFVNNVCCSTFTYGPGSESILEFSLSFDGGAPVSLGTITTNLALVGTWEGLSTQWSSVNAGSVQLRLINRNTNAGGNDFALDDVFFGTESIVNPNPVPEPGSLALLALGLAGLGFSRRREVT